MNESRDLELGDYRLRVATDMGPRITSLRLRDGPEIFARLSDEVTVPHPSGPCRLRGGHRLWVAPEIPDTTYAPDEGACALTVESDGFVVTASPDAAGFAKQISVGMADDSVVVDHHVTNHNEDTRAVAPWSITQLPLGGEASLSLGRAGPSDLQADRSLVVWPYTNMIDSRIGWEERSVAIRAEAGPRVKLGSGPRPESLEYVREGYTFVKWHDLSDTRPRHDVRWADLGAVVQVFCNEIFCELETVGPIIDLASGESTSHREFWRVHQAP